MDMMDCLAAFRRFQNVSTDIVAHAIGKAGPSVTRWELKSIGVDLKQAQIYANAIGAKITVRIEYDGMVREVPLYTLQEGDKA